MKKYLSLLLAILLLLSCVALTGCSKDNDNDNDDDRDQDHNTNGVKYELIDMHFSNVTVDHYEYNYIEFDFDEGTYILKNKTKANGIVTKQTGEFTVDDDNYVTITNDDIPAQDFFLGDGEEVHFENDYLYIEANIDGYGYVYMIFKK